MTFKQHLVATLVLSSTFRGAGAQSNNCYRSFNDIFAAECNAGTNGRCRTTNLNKVREYVICAGTIIEPGVADPVTGDITGGDFPLALRKNAHVKCGRDGSSSNNCIVDGTGSFAVFANAELIFQDSDMSNVIIEGLTFDSWILANQQAIIAGGSRGNIEFRDCKFTNNAGDPFFSLDMNEFGAASRSFSTARSAGESVTPKFIYNVTRARDNNGRRLLAPAERPGEADMSGVEFDEEHRELQGTRGPFTFIMRDSVFDFNQPVKNPVSQGGLSLVRISSTDPSNQLGIVEVFSNPNLQLLRNEFIDNLFEFANDKAGYRAIVDFYSRGELLMRQNCFTNSPANTYGPVIAQPGASRLITNDRNYVDPVQTDTNCPFVALINQDYMFVRCGPNAMATACRANVQTAAPTSAPTGGGFCFPGDARAYVQGKGQVLMEKLEIGDKVLVGNGKYEPIYSFGHRDEDSVLEYLKIIPEDSRPLFISKDHMVFIEGGHSVPASSVAIGDKLQLDNGKLASVITIMTAKKTGLYAPFTPSGTLIVNGVKTSNFIAFQDNDTLEIAGFDTGLTYQFLAHSFELPHRLWCRHISSCKTERYTPDGVSTWVALPHDAARWFLAQNSLVMAILAVPTLAFFVVLGSPISSLITLGAVLAVMYRTKSLFNLKST